MSRILAIFALLLAALAITVASDRPLPRADQLSASGIERVHQRTGGGEGVPALAPERLDGAHIDTDHLELRRAAAGEDQQVIPDGSGGLHAFDEQLQSDFAEARAADSGLR